MFSCGRTSSSEEPQSDETSRSPKNTALNERLSSFRSSSKHVHITRYDSWPLPLQSHNDRFSSYSNRNSMVLHLVEAIGLPSLKIYRLRLPSYYLQLLEFIINGCEEYAATRRDGWQTNLYSLTKQDIALRDIPLLYNAARPMTKYIKQALEILYDLTSIKMDRNQPHVLKYSAEDGRGHTGVQLHHDKCDFTVNVMLSKRSAYDGGGTYFPEAEEIVQLAFGEILVHPGRLVHGGVDITRGNRYCMILFAYSG